MMSKNVWIPLMNVALLMGFLLVGVSLLVSCVSAVPSYDAVELGNWSCTNSTVRDLTVVSSSDIRVSQYSASFKKIHTYTPEWTSSITVTPSGYVDGIAYDPDHDWLYFTDNNNGDVYRVNLDGTGQTLVHDYGNGVTHRSAALYNGLIYVTECNNGKLYREPYAVGEDFIVMYDFQDDYGVNFDIGAVAFRDDYIFLYTRGEPEFDKRVWQFDWDYNAVMYWNITFIDGLTTEHGMDFDAAGYLWYANEYDSKLYKISLPNCDTSDDDVYDITLSGKTYDIDGNIVSGVSVAVGALGDTSDVIGDYSISDIEFEGSITVIGNKTGYENYSRVLVGVYEDGTYLHDIFLIPDDELGNGDIGGLVYDYCTGVNIENALVNLYDKDTGDSTYIYANSNGFYRFDDLANNTNFTMWASKVDYEKSEKYSFFSDNTTHVVKDIWLLPVGGCVEPGPPPAPTPTPTPGPGDDEKPVIDGIKRIFDLLGLGDYMYYIFAFLCMLVGAASMGYITHDSTMGVLIGGFFGFVVDVALGWLPIWTVAVVICVTLFVIVKKTAQE